MRDIEVRTALLQEIKREHMDGTSVLVEEMNLLQGDVRIDAALLNGAINGYEIKSARDTLDRLPKQASQYSRVMDFMVLVTCENHIDAASRLIPEWWGIWEAVQDAEGVSLQSVREPQRNIAVEAGALVQLLWRDEVLDILTHFSLDKGIRSKPKRVLWERLRSSFNDATISSMVRQTLKTREDWPIAVRLE